MKTKVCVVTGSRAEYGLLYPLMQTLKEDEAFSLQIVVTGMHLSPEFGLTYCDIEKDGFEIQDKVEMLLSSDTDIGITKSTGLGMIGFADTFNRLTPDLVILLGDRFETFAAATAAYFAKIPIAHLHGGEVTEGATDEGLRHAISKMAFWHFTTTQTHRNRVIQLGENPDFVFNVGAIGIDNIKKMELMDRTWLTNNLEFEINTPFLLITYHPVTLEKNSAKEQFLELLKVLAEFPDLKFIFTKPNADSNGRIIIELIDDYVKRNGHRAASFVSLGQKRYLSLMRFAHAVVGNSSSGIIEAPSFGVPTVNIGDRQKGREKALSIIDSKNDFFSIKKSIFKAISLDFQDFCKGVKNNYGEGNTTQGIMEVLKNERIPKNLKKHFYDLH